MDPHAKPPCCRVSLAEICSLYQKLFQTPAEMRFVQAAVEKVCGARPHSGFCCSSKLLDVLVEVERQRWVKEQIYWDFQLLDFNRDSSLSLSDVKILLQRAQESQVTSMSWVDFLTQRQETSNRVTWSELEAWLFEASSPVRHGTLKPSSQPSFNENDQMQYQGKLMDESKRLKNQWDTAGLEVIVRAAEGTTNSRDYLLINQTDLSEAVDHKYAALTEKLFYDMLQAHYGSQDWTSMSNEQKQQNMNDLKMLAEFGLERGSELVLSQLPGATHNFRDEENSCSCKEAIKKRLAVQALKELQRRRELETSNLTNSNEGQSDSVSHACQYLLLFAQKIKVKMECNFSAALLVVEPYWKQRFWDEKPASLETCFEELAHIRLTIGQRMKQKLEKEQLGSKKLSLEEDKLLSLLKRQKEARDLLFQLLQSCSHEELQEPSPSLLHNTSEENTDLIKEVPEIKVERNPLRQLFLLAMTVTKTCLLDDREMVTWGDCAVRLLVQVQLKQELELRELIQELSRGADSDDHNGHQIKEPVLEENEPVSYLIHLLQPITPKEQLNMEQFKAELISRIECTKLHEELDNMNIKKACGNHGMMGNISKEEENKTSPYDNNATNITIVEQQKEDYSIRKKPPEKVHQRQTVTVSSMSKDHEKQGEGQQLGNSRKERNVQIETPYKGPGRGTSKKTTYMQNEEYEQTKHKHVDQVPSDELASSVMEATESLIAGLMTLKAKVEEVYRKKGTDEHSPPRPAGSDTEALSVMPKKGMHIQKEPKTMEKSPMKNTEGSGILNNTDSANISCYNDGELLNKEDDAEKGILDRRSISCGEGKQREVQELCNKEKEIAEEPEDGLFDRKAQLQLFCDERMDSNMTLHGEMKCNIPGDSLQTSTENLSSSFMEAAESLILSLKSLQEEFSHSAKSQLIENSGETTMGADSEPQKSVEVATRADFKNKQSTSSGAKNVEDLEDCKMPDASLGIQSDHVPDPMAREVSWELHPQCSQGCNHARLWDNEATKEDFSCEMMAGIESCAMSGRTPLENNIESLNCGVVCLDEKSKISLPEPLALRATQAAKSEDMSHTAAEKKHNDYHGEDDQKVPSREEAESAENSSAQEKGREEMALSTADGSSEDSSTEQGPADKLAMSFLEAAHNLIGELIPGKEEAGLSSVRRVVVILTDSENGDLIMGQGEELSDASGSISSVEPPIENTDDAEQVRCHSQGCDGTGTSQCQKIAEKEDQLNKLTSEKLVCSDDCGATNESHPKVLSNIEGVKEGNFLPTDEKIGANDMQDMEATMGDEIQKIKNEDKNKRGDDKNTISPRQKSNSGNITINVSTGERGDGLTQHEAGIDKTGVTDRGEEGAAKEHYKELVQDDETEVTTDRSQSVHSEDIEQMNNEACLCPGPDSMTHEEKADETSDRINLSQSETCSYEGPAGTVVKSVLLSTQDLIGSLTSLKEKLGKNDKMMRSVKTDSHILHSAEDCPNMHSNIHEESFSQSCDSLNGKGIIESTPNMVLGLSHVGAISEDRRVQPEENASARSEKGNHNMQQNDKASPIIADSSILQEHEQNLPIDNKDEEWVLGETGLAEKECLKHSTFRKGEAEGMVLENQGHIDWKKKWRSACEQQMDKLRKYDDDSKLESSISKRIKLQIIEKSKNESVSYKQKPRPPSLTAVPTESEMQEEVNQTSFRCEDEGNGEHTDDIQGNEGDLVTQSKNTGTEQTYSDTTMCGNNNEQGSLKDLTMSLLEATNCLIGRLASLKGELGRSQVSDSSVSCKEIEQNVQDIQEQESDVEVTDEAPTSLMMETEDSNSSSDIIRNRTTMDISTKKAENCQAMNNYPIQETSADEESRGVIQRQQARCEEKVESSEMVVSITSNLAIIQNNRNQGEHCHMLKGTQLEISTRSVETFHQIGNTDDTQMQFNNKTKISQEERSPNVQLTKHQEKDVPLTSESIEQAIPKEALSDTSYSLKVSHTQLTNDPLAKWKSIVMRKIKVSSEHNIYGMHNIKLGSVKSELVTSENSNGDMNVDTLKPTENEINEKIDTEPDDEKVEQMGDPQMKDLEEMQTLRSYIRDGVIKKREGEREEEKQNKETKNQSNEINPDQLNSQGSATSDLYHGKGLEGTDLHRLVSFDDRVLENKESLVKVNVKYTSYETDAMLKRSVTQETLIDHEIYAKEINAQEKFDDKTDTEQPMKLSRAVGPYLANFQKAERQSMAIIKQKPSPWLKFWEAANQTVAVAAVSTTQSSNFFGHLAQVPANGVLVRNEKQLSCPLPTFSDAQVKSPTLSEPSHGTKKKDRAVSSPTPQTCSLPPSEAALQREKVFIRLSLREQEEAMQRLTDLQRQAELKCTNDRSRQMLRFQERLSIAQNRKSELDLMEITQRISPQLSPETLPEGDLERQKSAVKEHLERVKRERTYIMQTKRDRNMSGFRELLDPVLSGQKREDSGSELKGVEGPSGTGQA